MAPQYPSSLRFWPVEQIELPALAIPSVSMNADRWLSWTHDPDAPDRPLPDEFVLRELWDLDLSRFHDGDATDDDCEALLDFVGNFGAIAAPHPGYAIPDFPWDPVRPPIDRDIPDGFQNHVDDVVRFLSEAKAVTAHWVAHLEDDYLSPAWRWLWNSDVEVVLPESEYWADFVGIMNQGLAAYPNRLEWEIGPDHFGPGVPGEMVRSNRPHLGLFSASCLQLRNLMLDPTELRRCENETCGRPFKRQRGSSTVGQSRTKGVRFCTPVCATTQAQRIRRRKERAER